MSKGEGIVEVTKLIFSITEAIIALRDDEEYLLPEKFVQKMITVMQTTNVPAFNQGFEMLEQQLNFNRRVKTTLDSPTLMGITDDFAITTPTSNWTFDNTPRSAPFLWKFANSTYQELQISGEWETAVRPEIEQNNITGRLCWNCDGDHSVKDCPEPIDDVRVEKNRKEHLQQRKEKRTKRFKSTKPTLHAWCPPEDDEHVKHGKPYTWNEFCRDWDKDETPDTGISAGISTGAHNASIAGTALFVTGTFDDGTVLTQGTMPQHEFAQLTLDITNVLQVLACYV